MNKLTTDEFTRLCEIHQTSLYYFILHRAVNNRIEPDMALDILQSTLFKAYEKRHTLRDIQKFVPWLFTIARNQAIRVLRKSSREILSEDIYRDYPAQAIARNEDIESAENVFILKNTRNDVTKLLVNLSNKEREFMIQYYYHDLSYKEISALTGTKEGALRIMHHRTLKKLTKLAEDLKDE